MTATDRDLFQAGVIVGTHGLRGDLKVKTLTEGSLSLVEAKMVALGRDRVCFEVARAVPHKGMILLRLQGRESLDAASEWIGAEVFMALDELPQADEGEHYWFELAGLTVVDEQLGELGTLEDIFTTPAHDIFVVQGRYGEVLIPVVDQFIVALDKEKGLLRVDLPAGLVDLGDQPKTA